MIAMYKRRMGKLKLRRSDLLVTRNNEWIPCRLRYGYEMGLFSGTPAQPLINGGIPRAMNINISNIGYLWRGNRHSW